MTFEEAKTKRAALEDAVKASYRALQEIREHLSRTLSVPADSPIGLTPDAIKFHPTYRQAQALNIRDIHRLREFNKDFVKTFKAALREERRTPSA